MDRYVKQVNKQLKAMRDCKHVNLSKVSIKDPNDGRRMLKPDVVMGLNALPCINCGCFVFIRK